ncbi:MAG: DUF4019 domain-containing protein [Nevskia sp.]|nr:DUF4019 domain-containing protein [Nevskia sp.]
MKNFILACTLGLCVIATQAMAGQAEDIAAAEKAAGDWLALVDDGKYPASWDSASSYFKSNYPKELWKGTAKGARGPIGSVRSRSIASATFTRTLPGAPDGIYVVVEYTTQFDKKPGADETVTLVSDTDNVWRVYGYNLN